MPNLIHAWLGEPLRQGTRLLFRELRRRGFSIWIYTTSVRTPFQIRLWLILHGIRVDGVINEERHRTQLAGRKFARMPSKYLPAFGIDLHVDDSEGVKMEGEDFVAADEFGGFHRVIRSHREIVADAERGKFQFRGFADEFHVQRQRGVAGKIKIAVR